MKVCKYIVIIIIYYWYYSSTEKHQLKLVAHGVRYCMDTMRQFLP